LDRSVHYASDASLRAGIGLPKMKRHFRWMAHALSFVLIIQTSACGSAPKADEVQHGCDDNASRLLSEGSGANAGKLAMFTYSTAAQSRCAMAAPAGRYGVGASV